MAILPILTYPALSLKKPSVEIKKFDSRLGDLVQDMFATMHNASGIGLAAPQIGENIHLFVMDVGAPDPGDPEKTISQPLCLINPRITNRQGIIQYEEGCLSCPELLVKMDRSKNIIVESFDFEGRPQKHDLSELAAVCVQHEMDHLKGKLLADQLSRLKRELYAKQLVRERVDEDDVGDV